VLPSLDVAAIRNYCEQRVAPDASDQVRLEAGLSRGAVTIVERRPPWREDAGPEWASNPIARLRYTTKSEAWTLYWCDSNARWHRYESLKPSADVRALLDEVDRDPTGIFWG